MGAVTCVWCCLRQRQHNRQHMRITRVKERLVKSRKRPEAPFTKKGLWDGVRSDLDA